MDPHYKVSDVNPDPQELTWTAQIEDAMNGRRGRDRN